MISKKGSYFVEAAVVFPVVIFTLLTLVMIVMYYYECSAEQSDMHMYLRKEAGETSGKTICYSKNIEDDYYVEQTKRTIRASKEVSMLHRGLLFSKGRGSISGSIYIIDGPRYVLRRQAISEIQ